VADTVARQPLTASSESAAGPATVASRGLPPKLDWRRMVLYTTPALTLYVLFVLWPLLHSAWLALQEWDGYGPQRFVGLRNFGDLAADPVFRTALAHSLAWELAAGVGLTVCGLGLALLIRQSRAHAPALSAIFFPALLPATVVAAVWTLVLSPLDGLLNTILNRIGAGGLAADWLGDVHLALPALFVAWAWSAVGIGTLLFWAALRSIGREYLELALVEGAGAFWRFRHVLLPAVRRTAILAVLINAALAGQVFDLIMVTTGGGPGYATMLLPVDMYGRAFGGRTGEGAAVAVVQIVLGLVLAGLALLLSRLPHASMSGDGTVDRPIRRPAGTWVATAALFLLLALLLLPLAWLLAVALGWGALTVGSPAPTLSPATWGWDNFSSVWSLGMGSGLKTSLVLAAGATVLTLGLAPPAAFALFRGHRIWSVPVAILLGVGLFQPTPVIIVPLFSLLKALGLLDTPWGVLLPEVARSLPFAVLLLWAFFTQVPAEVLQAAEVDGAAPFQQLWHVALPLVQPALLVAGIWAFVGSWNEYLLPTLVSQDGSLQTVPTLLGSFIGRFDTQFGLLAAGSLVALLPSLLIYLAFRRPAGTSFLGLERRWG